MKINGISGFELVISVAAFLALATNSAFAQAGSADFPSQGTPSDAQANINQLPPPTPGIQNAQAQPAQGQPQLVPPPPLGFGQFCIVAGMAYGPGPIQPRGAPCMIMGPGGPIQGFIN